ncbi:MAG: hypothetical protein LBN34_06575 [Clostridiales Family XIII bacterium]|jgi:hypothetical protein|nr:hypothetical protein [Clostridiales Family XIII bacterium]
MDENITKKGKFNKAKVFYELFAKLLKDENGNIKADALTAYGVRKDWKVYLNELLPKLLEEIECETYIGHPCVDVVGWSMPNRSVNDGWVNEYLWDLDVAIELEDDSEDWMNGVIKLCHLKCGLKVVISYSSDDDRDSDIDKLKITAANIQSLAYGGLTEDEDLLVILGNCSKNKYETQSDIGFKAYVYDDGKFKKLSSYYTTYHLLSGSVPSLD